MHAACLFPTSHTLASHERSNAHVSAHTGHVDCRLRFLRCISHAAGASRNTLGILAVSYPVYQKQRSAFQATSGLTAAPPRLPVSATAVHTHVCPRFGSLKSAKRSHCRSCRGDCRAQFPQPPPCLNTVLRGLAASDPRLAARFSIHVWHTGGSNRIMFSILL